MPEKISSLHSKRSNNFDLLRIGAALVVVFSHSFPVVGRPEPTPFINPLGLAWGNLGVLVFFSISGYLVAQSWDSDPDLWRYGAKRLLRIIPALAVAAFATALVLGPFVTTMSPPAYLASPSTWLYGATTSLVFAPSPDPAIFSGNPIPDINASLWTIPIESGCYVLLAFAASTRAFRLGFLAPIACALAVAGNPHLLDLAGVVREHNLPLPSILTNLSEVVLLVAAFAAASALYLARARVRLSPAVALALLVVAVGSRATPLGPTVGVLAIPYVVLTFALAVRPIPRGILGKADLSYGVYLFSFPLQQAIVYTTGTRSPWLVAALTIVVAVPLAAMSWRFVERPALRHKPRAGAARLTRVPGQNRHSIDRSSSAVSVLKRASPTVLARFFARFAQLAFLVVAARHLTIVEFGAYSYIVVLTLTISMVVDTGAGLTWGRLVTCDPSQVASLYWQGFAVVLLGAGAASGAVLAASWVDSGPGTVGVVVWAAAVTVLFNTLFNYSATMLRSLTRTGEEATVQALSTLVFVLAGLAVLRAGGGVLALIWVLAAKEGLSWIVCSGLLARDTGKPVWRGLGAVKLLGVGIRLSFISTALAVITRAPTIVLGNAASPREVAWFAAPMRFADAALMGATTVGLALLPFMTRLHAADDLEARNTARRLVVMAFCGFGALAVAFVPAADLVVTAVFGARYGPGAGAARILMLALPAYGVLGVLWYWMIASDDDAALARILGLGVVLSVVICATAVPAYGSIGAAWAYVVPLVTVTTAASIRFLGSAARASDPGPGRRHTIRRRLPASVAGAHRD